MPCRKSPFQLSRFRSPPLLVYCGSSLYRHKPPPRRNRRRAQNPRNAKMALTSAHTRSNNNGQRQDQWGWRDCFCWRVSTLAFSAKGSEREVRYRGCRGQRVMAMPTWALCPRRAQLPGMTTILRGSRLR